MLRRCAVRRGVRGTEKEGPSLALGAARRGALWPAPVLSSVNYQPSDAPCWEDSARRPDSASALRVGVGLARPDGSVTRPDRSGLGSRCRRWTATTARGVAATGSRAGWRARVRRVAGSRRAQRLRVDDALEMLILMPTNAIPGSTEPRPGGSARLLPGTPPVRAQERIREVRRRCSVLSDSIASGTSIRARETAVRQRAAGSTCAPVLVACGPFGSGQ